MIPQTLSNLIDLYEVKNCRTVYVKRLSPNDNSKNQIYLGGDFTALNLFPFSNIDVDNSSIGGSVRDRLKASIKFGWLANDDIRYNLVNLILYPKYPEVRLSGILKHKTAIDEVTALINSRDDGRLLFLGVTDDGKVIGHCVENQSLISKEFEYKNDKSNYPKNGIFSRIDTKSRDLDPRIILKDALINIVNKGWIKSYRLDKNGSEVSCTSSNCGGYTLEASLGIIPNGISEPDFHGWEVKQYGVKDFSSKAAKAITLMTPEPDGGIYRDKGILEFLSRYGYPDSKQPLNRRNFGGVHKVGEIHKSTKLQLFLSGYDVKNPNKWESNGAIQLVSENEVAASWSYSGLLRHWQRKHAQAVYVKSLMRINPAREYRYGNKIELGEGTDFAIFLQALAIGKIYYDPGIKAEGYNGGKKTNKRRSQFRVKSTELLTLYKKFTEITL